MRRLRGMAMAGLVAFGALGAAPATAAAAAAPCAEVQFDYFPRHVTPGQLMDMELSVTNCSAMRERLFLEVEPNGPCRFATPMPAVYDLGPGHGIGQSSLVLGPNCPGVYTARVRLTMQGLTLDRDRSGFEVSAT